MRLREVVNISEYEQIVMNGGAWKLLSLREPRTTEPWGSMALEELQKLSFP